MRINSSIKIKKIVFFLLAVILFLAIIYSSSLRNEKKIIPLSSKRGVALFSQSNHQNYWRLAQYYITQDNLHFCGVASIVMVLNAVNIPAPQVFSTEKYRLFTQENLFSLDGVSALLDQEDTAWAGMSFRNVRKVLQLFPLNVKVIYASDYSGVVFRQELIAALARENHYLIACYDRSVLGQSGRGHCSPLAAYDKYSDRVLVMDVSRFDSEPFWVKTKDLQQAMIGSPKSFWLIDSGYIEVSNVKNDRNPANHLFEKMLN